MEIRVFTDGQPRARLTRIITAGAALEIELATVDTAGRISFCRREIKTLDAAGLELLNDYDRGRIRSALLVLSREVAHV